MKYTVVTATIVAALGVAACKQNSTSPSAATTTTTSAPATTTTTTSTTTVPAANAFTLSGHITDANKKSNIAFPTFEVISGANIGRRWDGDTNGNYTAPNLTPGTFVVRAWAATYLVNDVTVTISNANVVLDIQLTPAPASTTVPPSIHAAFTWSPNPCTIDLGGVTCTVDATSSTGNIVQYHWAYASKDVFNQTSFSLSLGCGDLRPGGPNTSAGVRLTVVDASGAADSVDTEVPFTKLNGVCP